MANLELEGKLVRKLPVQSGRSARGDWSKQEFLLEFQEGNFPSTVVFSVWGADKVNELAKYSEGSTIKVAFNLSSREYNGKWYTDVRAWRISPAGQAASAPAPTPAPAPAFAPAPTLDDMPGDTFDDLPF